jgi:hypothetical protein
MTQRFAVLTVCDDVRTENNGKAIYSGIYNTEIFVEKIPSILPQIYFVVTAVAPKNSIFTRFRVRVERPGLESYFGKDVELPPQLNMAPEAQDPEIQFFRITSVVKIAPFEILEPGRIKVWVENDGPDIYAGSILIRPQAALESQAVNLQSLIRLIGFADSHTAELRENRDLEVFLREMLVATVPVAVRTTLSQVREPIVAPLGNNRFAVMFHDKLEQSEKLKFINKGNPQTKAKIEHIATHGVIVSFDITNEPIQAFEINFDNPNSRAHSN